MKHKIAEFKTTTVTNQPVTYSEHCPTAISVMMTMFYIKGQHTCLCKGSDGKYFSLCGSRIVCCIFPMFLNKTLRLKNISANGMYKSSPWVSLHIH